MLTSLIKPLFAALGSTLGLVLLIACQTIGADQNRTLHADDINGNEIKISDMNSDQPVYQLNGKIYAWDDLSEQQQRRLSALNNKLNTLQFDFTLEPELDAMALEEIDKHAHEISKAALEIARHQIDRELGELNDNAENLEEHEKMMQKHEQALKLHSQKLKIKEQSLHKMEQKIKAKAEHFETQVNQYLSEVVAVLDEH